MLIPIAFFDEQFIRMFFFFKSLYLEKNIRHRMLQSSVDNGYTIL